MLQCVQFPASIAGCRFEHQTDQHETESRGASITFTKIPAVTTASAKLLDLALVSHIFQMWWQISINYNVIASCCKYQ
jgi:hypothetical protein